MQTVTLLHRVCRFCAVFAVVALLMPTLPLPVQASPGYAYHWRVQFDFENNFNGLLIVEVGYNENGAVQQPSLHSRTFIVGCQRVGSVGLSGGVAKFSGGYLACDLDVKSAVEQTFAACDELHPGCKLAIGDVEQYRSLALAADLSAAATGVAPILGHPSVAYAVNVATSTHTVQTALAPIGTINSSGWGVAPALNTSYHSSVRYVCSLAGDCGAHFNIAGNPEYVNTADAPVNFVMTPSTLTIGHDLSGATVVAGSTIDNILIDPGNGLPE
ncbi:MAG: hypothetical protein R3E79_20990 [Caldilineaceae bacterium]